MQNSVVMRLWNRGPAVQSVPRADAASRAISQIFNPWDSKSCKNPGVLGVYPTMDVYVEHPIFLRHKINWGSRWKPPTETLENTCPPQNTHPHAHNFPQNSPQIPNANPKKTEPTCSDSSSLRMATLGNVTLQNDTKHLKLLKLSRRMNLQCKIWIISNEFRSFPIICGRITRSCTMLFHPVPFAMQLPRVFWWLPWAWDPLTVTATGRNRGKLSKEPWQKGTFCLRQGRMDQR